jgi:hypothetical protein
LRPVRDDHPEPAARDGASNGTGSIPDPSSACGRALVAVGFLALAHSTIERCAGQNNRFLEYLLVPARQNGMICVADTRAIDAAFNRPDSATWRSQQLKYP